MKSVEQAFRSIAEEEPRLSLRADILMQIDLLQSRQAYHQKRLSLAMIVFSLGVFFVGVYQYGLTLIQSDFWTLLSLIFSDLGVLMSSLQDFSYSLLETLPLVPLLALLAPIVLFFWSMSLLLAVSEKRQYGIFSGVAAAH